jgi:hypothetical protein
MEPSEPTPFLFGLDAVAAEVRARIDRDKAEIAAELGERPLIEDALARRRTKRSETRPQDAT